MLRLLASGGAAMAGGTALRSGLPGLLSGGVDPFVRDLAEIEHAGYQVFGKPTVIFRGTFENYKKILKGLDISDPRGVAIQQHYLEMTERALQFYRAHAEARLNNSNEETPTDEIELRLETPDAKRAFGKMGESIRMDWALMRSLLPPDLIRRQSFANSLEVNDFEVSRSEGATLRDMEVLWSWIILHYSESEFGEIMTSILPGIMNPCSMRLGSE